MGMHLRPVLTLAIQAGQPQFALQLIQQVFQSSLRRFLNTKRHWHLKGFSKELDSAATSRTAHGCMLVSVPRQHTPG